MKNSWNDWGNNFIEWPENIWKKVVLDTKSKVYWVYFVASVVNVTTGAIEDEFQYSTLSEDDYKKVLETKYSINPPDRIEVDVRNWFWIIRKAQLWVQGVYLVH